MKKHIITLILLTFLLVPFQVYADEMPGIHGEYGVAIDARTGEVIYDKNANEKAYPASITKMITAMLLDDLVEDGEMLTASEFATTQEASNLHFKLTTGEKLSKEDAMKALLIISANDVAVTIAEHISGSQEEFAKLMTKKAMEIGATNTNFMTASGLHDPNHYTTAHDMALIAKEIVDHHPNVLKVMGMKSATITTSERTVEITNPSKIHDNPIALGGKTGYTHTAQNTLVEILEKDHKLVISVVMKTTLAEEYNDIEIMGDYAFTHMKEYKKIMDEGKSVLTKEVKKKEINYILPKDVYMGYDEGKNIDYTTNVVKYKLDKETIKKGEEIGELEIVVGKKVAERIPLVSDKNITFKDAAKEKEKGEVTAKNEKDGSFSIFHLLISVLIPMILYIAFVIFYNYKKRNETRHV